MAASSSSRSLRELVDEAFFTVASLRRNDHEAVRAVWDRREPPPDGAKLPGFESGPLWLFSMARSLTPIAAPRWLPMGDVAHELTLEHGARGLRSLFTTKASDKQVAQARRLGSLTVRALVAVLGADGSFAADGELLRSALIAAMALPEEDRRLLEAERPMAVEALDAFGDIDPKVARGILRGAFYAAVADGLDPREEQAIIALAPRLGLTIEAIGEARTAAREFVDGSRGPGEAATEAVRFMAADSSASELATLAAELLLPGTVRGETLTAIEAGPRPVLARRHAVDRDARDVALALSWLAVLRDDPRMTERAQLAVRHDQLVKDLGGDDGAAIRLELEALVQGQLVRQLRA